MSAIRQTLTLDEARIILKENGFLIGKDCIADGIARGIFGFGTMLSQGEYGRRTFLIFRKDLMAWISDKVSE